MEPVPSTYSGAANAIGVVVLLIEFGMLRQALVRDQVRLYAGQSLLISVLAVVIAANRGIPELYVLAGLSFLLKVVIVPLVFHRQFRRTELDIAGSGALSVASAVLVSIAVAAFGFFTARALHIGTSALPESALSLAMAIVLVAFVLMVIRRDVASQAIGFFSLENGVSMTSLVIAAELPLILEVAFLFDLLVAVVVFGVLMRVHQQRRSSLSTADLAGLRG